MKIYVISQAVEDRMHTPRLLRGAGIPFTLVLDNQEQAKAAHKMGYYTSSTMSTDTCKGVVAKRNAITAHAHEEFYIGLDDNIREFTKVADRYMGKVKLETSDTTTPWRKYYNVTCEPAEYIKSLELLAEMCYGNGTAYAGVATMENPFFRGGKRYAFRRFVKTKAFVMDATPQLQFKHSMCHDSYMTALTIAKYGRVVVDQRLFYKSKWYEKGGLGSRAAREESGLLTQLNDIVVEFPGLVGLGKGKNTALRVLKTSDASVDNWRREHGYL